MKLGQRNLAFLGGAVVLAVVIVAIPARHSSSELAVAVAAHPVEPSADGKLADEDAGLLREQRARSRQVEWARDPFSAVPAGSSVRIPDPVLPAAIPAAHSHAPLPRLSAISLCGGDSRAVIDRQVVQSGDRLASGYTVQKITARNVTLTRDQEELVLSLGDQP